MSRAIEWILLGAGSCTAIIVGLRWHRPARVVPWLLLAGAIAALAIGDVFYAFDEMPFATGFYLAMFVLVAGALLQFTQGGSVLVDRARLIDLLAFACAALLIVWVFVIGDNGFAGEIAASDVIGSLLLIAVAIRLNLAVPGNVAAMLLLAGSVGLLAGDVLYPLFPGEAAESGYRVLYVAWGLAALHPSMVRLTQPMTPSTPRWRGRWAALLGASVATPPIVLLIEALQGEVNDGVPIAIAGAITLTLTITRLADSATLNSLALGREQGLRGASTALVAAADVPAVDEAVRRAVAALLPHDAVGRVVFAPDDRRLAAEALPPAPPGRRRTWWVDGSAPVEASSSVVIDAGMPFWRRGRDLLNRRFGGWFRSGSAGQAGEEATLVCPLWLEPLAVARPSGGALVLTGRRDALTAAHDALEVLAGQAALALDRISLVEAVGRRDSDLYLRAVISNTADLMLVLDEDQRIRYASPALHDLLGEDNISPLATLEDLVHPDDRGQIRRAFTTGGDGTIFCALRRPDHSQTLVEATYRDLRGDRLVQGFVVTMRNAGDPQDTIDRIPHRDQLDELPAWINRRSAQHKFRY
ncbi:PAS domain-containing protein [Paractinoplanes lichenicola]|uniref:PAS domain-containing protein n=1 Tax=Paractinoplanes lichenicola TaxID=2802976 RepID=A0ABS1VRD5_9ACTN|nr:PAS domain-containing protein [Actinoplanes lichenicola]MBL7256111.1 PAS domain-containing protein [Actinoplanes lichenicola]